MQAAVGLAAFGRPFGATVESQRLDAVLCIIAGAVAFFVLCATNSYDLSALRRPLPQIGRALCAIVTGSIAVLYLGWLLQPWPPGLLHWLAAWAVCSLVLLAGLRSLLVPTLRAWTNAGRLSRNVAVVGVNNVSRRLIESIRQSGSKGLRLFGVYHEQTSNTSMLHAGYLVRGYVADLVQEVRSGLIDTVVIALPASSHALAAGICDQIGSFAADIQVLPDLSGLGLAGRYGDLEAGQLLTVAERPLKDWRALRKQAFDVAGAAALLILLAPLMLLVAALIRLESEGPALFRQERTGFNNLPFTIYKFRTMYHNLADPRCERQTTRGDRRVTRVGRWLRRSSIDELPQLLNVLKGDMSLVGPRPHAPRTRAGDLPLESVVSHYASRHRMKPGITGWAQVNGCRGEIRSADEIRHRVEHDLYYIQHWSLTFDLKILFMTLAKEVVSGRAY